MAPSRGVKRHVNGAPKLAAVDSLNPAHSNQPANKSKIVTFVDETQTSAEPGRTAVAPSKLRQRAQQLIINRQQLPIWNHADEIRSKLRSHATLLLVAETGSGKSTQVPQFLINEPWCRRKRLGDGSMVGGCIAITEPRRVAAISLARRVAEEMGTPLGTSSPASHVGYSVRFDNSTGPATRIKFVTEGMLLQEMLRDPWLKDYSAVIVDEVHERGLNVDLVLGFLRRIQEQSHDRDGRGGYKMKAVVMSATADMEKINDYFGQTNNKDEEEWNGFSEDDESPHMRMDQRSTKATAEPSTSTLAIKGRQHPVTIHYAPSPIADILEAAFQRIINIHTHAPLPGDVLVFLTGQETVESLLSLVESYSTSIRKDPQLSSTLPSLLILPLYAALPAHLQQRVFQTTPKFTRKIIIATNIAETSITVPGIRFVIDTGKHKRRLFRPSLNLDSLLTAPISRSSANQRSGRAGRDAPGQAYRLYTEQAYYSLAADSEPEILRCDLSQLVLILKSHGVDDLAAFPLLTPPPRRSLERAIMHLLQLSALHPTTGTITPLGKEMSLLPLPSHLARILLSSTLPQYDCVAEIIDIVSALSAENIILNIHTHSQQRGTPLGDESDSDSPSDPRLFLRSQLQRREGDHLTLLAVVQAYVDENTDRKRWCTERGISHRAMQAVMDARKQLTGIMQRRSTQHAIPNHSQNFPTATISSSPPSPPPSHSPPAPATTSSTAIPTSSSTPSLPPSSLPATDLPTRILKCLLTGLHPNVARLSLNTTTSSSTSNSASSSSSTHTAGPTPAYITLTTHQPISIHPSSVLFRSTLRNPQSRNNASRGSRSHNATTHISQDSHDSHRALSTSTLTQKPTHTQPTNPSTTTLRPTTTSHDHHHHHHHHHPARPEAIMSSEFVFTTKPYARCVSRVQLDWVRDVVGPA